MVLQRVAALIAGAVTLAVVNAQALRPPGELYTRFGIRVRFPLVDATEQVITRAKARNRTVLIATAALTAAGALALPVVTNHIQHDLMALVGVALIGRCLADMMLLGLEACRVTRDGRPRVSPVQLHRLGEMVVAWPFVSVSLVQLAFVLVFWAVFVGKQGVMLAGGASLVLTAGGCLGASWLASQPTVASSGAELYGTERLGSESVCVASSGGPLRAIFVMVAAEHDSATRPWRAAGRGLWALWGSYFLVAVALMIAGCVLASRRVASRCPDGVAQ